MINKIDKVKLFGLSVTLYVLFSGTVYAQKIKYKDLYPLFQARKYTEAESFLKKFLSSNPDHPNANYQLGITYDLKARALNVLNENEAIPTYADSAVLFYSKAKTLITEKEIKKRDEYYEKFSRRDLRTGKFNINISDVHLDIEDRIDALKSYGKQTDELNKNLQLVTSTYDEIRRKYQSIRSSYDSYNQLLLGHDTSLLVKLDSINDLYAGFEDVFSSVRESALELETDYYEPSLSVLQFKELDESAESIPDFQQSEIEVYNFPDWVANVKKTIDTEINPIKEGITRLYGSLDSSIAVVGNEEPFDFRELDIPPKEELIEQVQQYDENTVLEPLFHFMEYQLLFEWYHKPFYFPALNDSANVDGQVDINEKIVTQLLKIDSISGTFPDDISEAISIYSLSGIDDFKDPNGFEEQLEKQISEYKGSIEKWQASMDYWQEKSRFAFLDEESIPLYNIEEDEDFKYRTQAVVVGDSAVYASGMIADSVKPTLFLGQISHSRSVNWLKEVNIGIDNVLMDSLKIQLLEKDDPGKILFAFAPADEEDTTSIIFKGQLLKFSRDGEKEWDLTHEFSGKPKFMEFDTLVSETKIYFDFLNDSGVEEVSYIIVDSSGKIR